MKKIINRISTLLLVVSFMFLNVTYVGAYTQNIVISDDINIPNPISANNKNVLSLTNDLKNNSAVVNVQYVKLTQEQFDTITSKFDSNNKYIDEQKKLLEEMANKLKVEEQKLNELKVVAEKEGATAEQKIAYEQAAVTYNNNLKVYSEKSNVVTETIYSNNVETEKLIPSYDDSKWTKITLKESKTTSNVYEFDGTKNDAYFVIWVKVTLNGKDYYNYDIQCNKEEELKYYCEYKNGKYYNKAGNVVTKEEYEADCLEKKYCEISNGKYYNKEGKEVTKEEYEADCLEKKYCEYKDGKYYNKSGKEVTKEEYEADCIVYEEPKLCKIEDGKYYDNEGFEVSKEDYEKACTTPDNPKTGLTVNIVYGVLITLIATSSYVVVRKYRKFSR